MNPAQPSNSSFFRAVNDSTEFRYVHSCDLESCWVYVKIGTLEGSSLPRLNYEHLLEDPLMKFCGRNQDKFPDLMIEAVLVDGTPPKFGNSSTGTKQVAAELHLPVATSYKHFTKRWEWNEWIQLPLKYSDLPRNALLCLTIYDCGGSMKESGKNRNLRTAIGGTTISLFGKKGLLRQGQMDLRVWAETAADQGYPTSTPGKPPLATVSNGISQVNQNPEFHRLSKLTKKYRSGKIQAVDWLDGLSFAEIEKVNSREKERSNLLFLMVEFPEFQLKGVPYSVVFYEKEDSKPDSLENEGSLEHPIPNSSYTLQSDIILLPDTEIGLENLVEAKHHRLARSARAVDTELKPDTAELRNRLNEITEYLPTQNLSADDTDLVWRYRFYLAGNKKALTKFVKSINWNAESEANQALEHITKKWVPIDVSDALELLGPTFRHPGLRQYAVNRLKQAPNSDLEMYLLQLVQALKYEPHDDQFYRTESIEIGMESKSKVGSRTRKGGLVKFLIDRACKNDVIANYLYWYLMIECEDYCTNKAANAENPYVDTAAEAEQLLSQDENNVRNEKEIANVGAISTLSKEEKVQNMYYNVLEKLKSTLRQGPSEWKDRLLFLERQATFVQLLVGLIKAVRSENGSRQKKIEKLKKLLMSKEKSVSEESEDSSKHRIGKSKGAHSQSKAEFNFMSFNPPLKHPLDPNVIVKGIIPDKATLFKSSLMPAKLTFIRDDEDEYVTIFKYGDDLRQDQLILQIITLMDRILKQENLDLKLTPYRVLATSASHGFVQYVESSPIAEVLLQDGSIQNFFRKWASSETGPYGIQSEVMDTYVKSCAGYCVVTYLLGVGDRHLDNLMLTKTGKLFHIDFGYILGRDPKVMPPPMKLSKEMIEAFGGMQSDHFQDFRRECYTAFLSLRRYANLILNLFSLMVDASVPDIALEPDHAVRKVQDKFRLDLSDEEAISYMQDLIDESANAVMAALAERLHRWAQFMRN